MTIMKMVTENLRFQKVVNEKLVFFTGVPGSRWSGVAQRLKRENEYNITDRAPHRVYRHGDYDGHLYSVCHSELGGVVNGIRNASRIGIFAT